MRAFFGKVLIPIYFFAQIGCNYSVKVNELDNSKLDNGKMHMTSILYQSYVKIEASVDTGVDIMTDTKSNKDGNTREIELAKADLYKKLAEAENQIENGEPLLDAEEVFRSLKRGIAKQRVASDKEVDKAAKKIMLKHIKAFEELSK
jgi:transcription termination factor NusB